jgi:hypothetical protein
MSVCTNTDYVIFSDLRCTCNRCAFKLSIYEGTESRTLIRDGLCSNELSWAGAWMLGTRSTYELVVTDLPDFERESSYYQVTMRRRQFFRVGSSARFYTVKKIYQ